MRDSRERPGGINHRPGRTIMPGGNHAPKQGVQWTFRPTNPLIEWASADADSWGLYLLS